MSTSIPPMSTQQYLTALNRGIRKHFVDEYKAKRPKLEKLLTVMSQEDFNEEHMDYTGAGTMQIVPEGTKYPVSTLLEGYKTTYVPQKLGDTIQVTYEVQKWDKSGLTKAENIAKAQAKQVTREMERLGSSLFRNGFNTAYTSYGDAKPLFSTSHTRTDGGTAGSNASASGITLTADNLDEAIIQMREQKDGRGELIETIPQILLVPPRLMQEALTTTKSMQKSGTANNDTNVFKLNEYEGGNLKVIVWDYLATAAGGSDTAWMLIDPEVAKLNWLWAERPKIGEMDTSNGFLNDTYYWKVMFYASIGWDDWRGTWASQGNGLTYSS